MNRNKHDFIEWENAGRMFPVTALKSVFCTEKYEGREIFAFDRLWNVVKFVYLEKYPEGRGDEEILRYRVRARLNRERLLSFLDREPFVQSVANYKGSLFAPYSEGNTPNSIFALVDRDCFFDLSRNLQSLNISYDAICQKAGLGQFIHDGDVHVILSLLFNRLVCTDVKGDYLWEKSINSELVVFNPDWSRKVNGKRGTRMIIGLAILFSKGCCFTLNVRTYSPLASLLDLYSFDGKKCSAIMSRDRYVNHGTDLRPFLLPVVRENGQEKSSDIYVLGTLDRKRRHMIDELVFNGRYDGNDGGKGKYESACKQFTFDRIMQYFNSSYQGIVCLDYEHSELVATRRLGFLSSRRRNWRDMVSGLFQRRLPQMRIVSLLKKGDEYERYVDILADSLSAMSDDFHVDVGYGDVLSPSAFNIVVNHNADYFEELYQFERLRYIREHGKENLDGFSCSVKDSYKDSKYKQSLDSALSQFVTVETLKDMVDAESRHVKMVATMRRNRLERNGLKSVLGQEQESGILPVVAESLDSEVVPVRLPDYFLEVLFNEFNVKDSVVSGRLGMSLPYDVSFGVKKIVKRKGPDNKFYKIPLYIVHSFSAGSDIFSVKVSKSPYDDFGPLSLGLSQAFSVMDDTLSDKICVAFEEGVVSLVPASFKVMYDYSKNRTGSKSTSHRDSVMPGFFELRAFCFHGEYYLVSGDYCDSARFNFIEKAAIPRCLEFYGCLESDSRMLIERLMNLTEVLFFRQSRPSVYPFAFKLLNEYFKAWLVSNDGVFERIVSDSDMVISESDSLLFAGEQFGSVASSDTLKKKTSTNVGVLLGSSLSISFYRFCKLQVLTVPQAVRFLVEAHSKKLSLSGIVFVQNSLFCFSDTGGVKNLKTVVSLGIELYEYVSGLAEDSKTSCSAVLRDILKEMLDVFDNS